MSKEYFRFASEAEAIAALKQHFPQAVKVEDGKETLRLNGHLYAIVTVGPVPDKLDDKGNVLKVGDDRFHVNIRALTPEAIEARDAAWEVHGIEAPATPYRVIG